MPLHQRRLIVGFDADIPSFVRLASGIIVHTLWSIVHIMWPILHRRICISI